MHAYLSYAGSSLEELIEPGAPKDEAQNQAYNSTDKIADNKNNESINKMGNKIKNGCNRLYQRLKYGLKCHESPSYYKTKKRESIRTIACSA